MFNAGNKVKCIDSSAQSVIYLNQIYTVRETMAPDFIRLIELPGFWWRADRFILERDQSSIQLSNMPVGLSAWLPSETTIDELMFSMNKAAYPQHIFKCECGTDSLGGGQHSDYCPKYTKA